MKNPRSNRKAPKSVSGRWAAYTAVLDVLRGSGFVEAALSQLRAGGRLEGREAALATSIALGTVRHLVTIEHLLRAVAEYDESRVQPELRAILATAAYQLVWADRIPEFAAVDEAVELARREVGGKSTGMVNAILRNVTRAILTRRVAWERLNPRQIRVDWDHACEFNAEVLPPADAGTGVVAHLAAATGERRERFAALVERFGAEPAEAVAWASQAVPAIALHRNVLRINAGVFQSRVREEFGEELDWTPDVAFLPSSADVVHAALFGEGRAYVQDVSANEAARLLDARPGERVLDFCAAPGGKCVVLAQQMNDRGEVVACDASPDRIVLVRENLRRLRLTSVRTHLLKTSDASEEDLRRQFDAALVDVPCSNTGVIARRPEARLGLTSRKLDSLNQLQAALLRRAAASVRPGGRLVYSTCSIEPEENERLVEAFVAECQSWRIKTTTRVLPQWGSQLSDWRDGAFAALLVRAE